MQQLIRRASRRSLPAALIPPSSSFFSSLRLQSFATLLLQTNFQKSSQRKIDIPGDFVRRLSFGPYSTSRFASGFEPLQPKPLDSIIDIERVKDLSVEDLAKVWDDYHLGRGHIGVSMKAELYHLLEQRAVMCPYFVIPLRRGGGFTTMFTQARPPHILLTGLEDYKARGTEAAPYATLVYYTEFAGSKDLVLGRGDVVLAGKVSDSEVKWLLEALHSFYWDDGRFQLVEGFNREPDGFEFRDVLQVLAMPSM